MRHRVTYWREFVRTLWQPGFVWIEVFQPINSHLSGAAIEVSAKQNGWGKMYRGQWISKVVETEWISEKKIRPTQRKSKFSAPFDHFFGPLLHGSVRSWAQDWYISKLIRVEPSPFWFFIVKGEKPEQANFVFISPHVESNTESRSEKCNMQFQEKYALLFNLFSYRGLEGYQGEEILEKVLWGAGYQMIKHYAACRICSLYFFTPRYLFSWAFQQPLSISP